jgi:hypothetical protein
MVESIFETNIIPNNPIRVQRIEGDRLMRLPAKALKRWLQVSQSSPHVTATPLSAELPRYQFKVTEDRPQRFDDDDDASYLVEDDVDAGNAHSRSSTNRGVGAGRGGRKRS